MLCFLILAVAVHGVPKNIQDFVYFFDNNIFIYSISKCNPKLMSCGQVKIISEASVIMLCILHDP